MYLIDARKVTQPDVSDLALVVDWSFTGTLDVAYPGLSTPPRSRIVDNRRSKLVSPSPPRAPSVEPRLSSVEIDVIRQLSTRANVLPILAHSDSLSVDELEAARAILRNSLATAFGKDPRKGFGVFGEAESDGPRVIISSRETLIKRPQRRMKVPG